MAESRWDVPQSEEGLEVLLRRLAESREAGDQLEVGRGLLTLAHLVKWVRSDNHEAPFDRSRTLGLEALEIFRREGNLRGQVSSLLTAAPFVTPVERDRMLDEAETLARESEDETLLARVLLSRGQALGLNHSDEAARMNEKALEIFLRHDQKVSAAACLFGLALRKDSSDEKYASALESARLYRESSLPADAARSMIVALMNGEEFMSYTELEPHIRQGLTDAQAEGKTLLEVILYRYLVKVATEKGDIEEAAKYLRWQNELEESNGMSPAERRRYDIESTKSYLALARKTGNEEAAEMFAAELKRLRGTRTRKQPGL